MGFQFAAAPVTEEQLQGYLSEYTHSFGFEETFEDGQIDVVTDWIEVTAVGGANTLGGATCNQDTGAAASGIASLELNQRFPAVRSLLGTTLPFTKIVMEFVGSWGGVADSEDAETHIGFANATGSTGSSTYITGFHTNTGAIEAYSIDAAGAETTAITGVTLTTNNVYRIEMYTDKTEFYINDTLVATHVTAVVNNGYFLLSHIAGDATGGAVFFGWKAMRVWCEK